MIGDDTMATLVINVPSSKTQQQGKRSFADTIQTGIGDGYYVSPTQRRQLGTGPNRVVVIDKDAGQAYEGDLVDLQPNGWTLDHKQRYDVVMRNLTPVNFQDFENVHLEEWGVGIIP